MLAVGVAGIAFTVIVANPEFAEAHTPFCTTALKYVVTVNAPIVAPLNVVEVFAISTVASGPLAGKVEAVDFCHFVTPPVLRDKVKSAGVVPEQID